MFKKFILLFSFLLLISCTSNENIGNCIQPLQLGFSRSFNNPDLNRILTPGYVEIQGGLKGILVINRGLDRFLAFDRICPLNNCDEPMTFDGVLLKCPCDGSTYSVDLGGVPQTEGINCGAIEYRAVKNGNTLTITNF